MVFWEGCGVGERLESRWEDGWDVTSEMMSVQKTMVDVRWKKTWNRCRFRGPAHSASWIGLTLGETDRTADADGEQLLVCLPLGPISHTRKKRSSHDGHGVFAETRMAGYIATGRYAGRKTRTSCSIALPLSLGRLPPTTMRCSMDWEVTEV